MNRYRIFNISDYFNLVQLKLLMTWYKNIPSPHKHNHIYNLQSCYP